MPRAPAEYLGVINLRGKIVPVIDLRIKFGLQGTPSNRECVVVLQSAGVNGASKLTGLLVDEVLEVIALATDQIAEAPSFGCATETTFLNGLARTKTGVIFLLDLDRLLGAPKMESAQ